MNNGTEKNRKKTKSITTIVVKAVILLSVVLTAVCLVVSYVFFIQEITRLYEEMDRQIAIVARASVSWDEMYMLAARTNRVYRSMENPREFRESDPEAYQAKFSAIQDSEQYRSVWKRLNSARLDSTATAMDFVLLYPEENTGVYVMDTSDVNIQPCGEIFDMDLSGYVGDPGHEFEGVVTYSGVYGSVRTDGVALVTDPSQGIYGYLTADIPVTEIIKKAILFLFQTTALAAIATILLCIYATRYFNRRVVRPMHALAGSADEFTGNYELRSDTQEETHIFENVDGGDVRELDDLAGSLQSMELEINTYIRDIATLASERARISTELDIATRIQASMLPSTFPAFPDRTEFDLYATMKPAKEVGGDFYDYFLIDDDHLALVMADVSGKGVPAALFMTVSKSILKYRALNGGSPADILSYVNNCLCEENGMDMFVTIWFGILTISTGELTAANAGHEYPIFTDETGAYVLIKDKHGFVCGGMPDMKYREATYTLSPGGRLFLYTDGAPEATNLDKELFGTERLVDALNECKEASPKETLSHVTQRIDEFVGPAEQFDDTTMLCLIYQPGLS